MSENNKRTVISYEQKFEEYIANTISVVDWEVKAWIDAALSYVQKNELILEVGTWPGRDADYIEGQWYTLQRSDGTAAFVEYNIRKWKSCLSIDLLHNTHKEKYNLILANAVFLHFTREDMKYILDDLKKNLFKNWFLAFTLKKWFWDEYSFHKVDAERYFCYWAEKEIVDLLVICWYITQSIKTTLDGKWIHIIARKES